MSLIMFKSLMKKDQEGDSTNITWEYLFKYQRFLEN